MSKEKIIQILSDTYRGATCGLVFSTPFELLVATILSAQCTDVRVNMVTPGLFEKFPDCYTMASASIADVEELIKTCGFYKNKAKNIVSASKKIVSDFGGVVPKTMDELTSLPGVGRKTANVVRGNWYGIPSVVVDTHVKRASNLLGLTKNEDPVKIEFDLMKIVPKEKWIDVNTQMIAHGRKICVARRPKCQECFLLPYCTGGKALEKEKAKKTKTKA